MGVWGGCMATWEGGSRQKNGPGITPQVPHHNTTQDPLAMVGVLLRPHQVMVP